MDFKIRKDRKPQGRKKLARERAAYFQLMQQGYSSREACRIVGVDVRTGKKWRNGHHSPGQDKKPVPPETSEGPASAGSGRYLAEDERIHIADRRREKAGIRTIARELGRWPSTISRELRRNHHPNSKQYRPHAAQARADARRPVPNQERSPRTQPCGSSSSTTWAYGGVLSRSARRCAAGFPAVRRCTWPTRRSIRRCTCKDAASCAAS